VEDPIETSWGKKKRAIGVYGKEHGETASARAMLRTRPTRMRKDNSQEKKALVHEEMLRKRRKKPQISALQHSRRK